MELAARGVRRYAVIGFGALVVLLLLIVLFPWNWVRGPVASIASGRLHRSVAIGHLAVDWGFPTRITLEDVTLGNVEWSKTQPMATFPRMVFSFRIPSLLRLSPDNVALTKPDVLLERNSAGEANWRFGDGDKGAALGAIDVDDGRIRYRDAVLPASVDGTLQTESAASRPLKFNGRGTLRGDPFEITGTSEGFTELRDVDSPYHLVVNAKGGATSMDFDGTVVPANVARVEGMLHLKGPDLSQLYPIVPSPLPWTPPYNLKGNLKHENGQWIFRDIQGTVGDSDLAGDFTVDVSKPRHLTTADLTSRKMNYKDLGGFIGLPPGDSARSARTVEQKHEVQKRAATNRVLPDKSFSLDRLRDHDVDVKFRGKSFKWEFLPIDQVTTHIVLKDGVMRFDPLDFAIADGHVISSITLDANKDVPTAQVKIEARNVELKRIFPQLASPNGSAGRFGGRAQFRTRGNSVRALWAAADGEAAVAMRGGEASTLRLVLTNIDLASAAQLLIGGDQTAAIHCAVGAFHAKDGVMTPDLFVVDTSAELITGSGSVDFRTEQYDLHLKANSKKPSILALKGPVVIGGTFKTPAVHPEVGPLVARVGASVGLGLLAGPLALLPLIDLGDAPDADCKSLYQDARVQTGTTERIARPNKPARGKSTVKSAAN